MKKIEFETRDGLCLNGLIYNGDKETKKILISIHGMTSNCLKKRDEVIAKKLNKENIEYLVFNNRGTEVMSYFSKYNFTSKKYEKVLIGTALEDIEDSYFDIIGVIEFALELGYEEIYLQGHSLGSSKIVYSYNKLVKEKSSLLKNIKAVILLSLIDIVSVQKFVLKDKYDEVLDIAEKNEKENNLDKLMPEGSFSMCPISSKTYLRYFRDNKESYFARFSDKDYNFKELNSIECPIFMRWGNNKELILQDANALVKFIDRKIILKSKNINFIDGANHNYLNKENILAEEINSFIETLTI